MITIISGTNRPNSMTAIIAGYYASVLKDKSIDYKIFPLNLLGSIDFNDDFYNVKSEHFLGLQNTYLIPSDKFIFIIPEYNGMLPGALKLMIDMSDVKQCWYNKKACLTGVSDGRAGCLRGLDVLTNCLNYLKMEVMPNKLPFFSINSLVNQETQLLEHQPTMNVIEKQLTEFISY